MYFLKSKLIQEISLYRQALRRVNQHDTVGKTIKYLGVKDLIKEND